MNRGGEEKARAYLPPAARVAPVEEPEGVEAAFLQGAGVLHGGRERALLVRVVGVDGHLG
jgi:hypothetical protein